MKAHGLKGSKLRQSTVLVIRGVKAEWKVYIWAILASTMFGVLTVGVSRVLGEVTDRLILPAMEGTIDVSSIWLGGLALAGVALGLALAVAARRIFAGIGLTNLQARHRRKVTGKYLELPMSWHRAHPTGQLLSNVSSDVDAANAVFNPLPFALGVCVMIFVAAGALLRLDVWLALAAMVVLPVMVAVNAVFQRYMSPAVTHAQQLRGEVADVAHESFEAALLVKSLGTRSREEERFSGATGSLRKANVRVGIVRACFDPIVEFLPSLGTLLVLGVGAFRAAGGHVDTGDIVSAAYLLTMMGVPMKAFGWVLADLPRSLVGYDRISQVLDAKGMLVDGTDDRPKHAGSAGMKVELADVGITVKLPNRDAELLRGVTLNIPSGSTVAVVGPTGSGKTTLVSLLSRLSDPTTGHVLLDGVDAKSLSSSALTSAVSLVAQSTFIFEDTIRSNITLADSDDSSAPNDEAVWEALRIARVEDVVRALPQGLDSPLGERGSNLSGGQRQRIALARALVRQPALLVLDDATSAVDPEVERAILSELRKTSGATVVMVAYRMSSVALADQVIHLESGRIVDVGTHVELLARDPGYRELALAYQTEATRREDAK